MGRSRNDRNGSRRRALRARLRAMRLPCAICGAPIDYDLPPGHPLAFECDEVVPVALGGSELDWSNLQPAHRICNQRKGARLGFACEPPTAADVAAYARGRGPRHAAPPPAAPRVSPSQDWAR